MLPSAIFRTNWTGSQSTHQLSTLINSTNPISESKESTGKSGQLLQPHLQSTKNLSTAYSTQNILLSNRHRLNAPIKANMSGTQSTNKLMPPRPLKHATASVIVSKVTTKTATTQQRSSLKPMSSTAKQSFQTKSFLPSRMLDTPKYVPTPQT